MATIEDVSMAPATPQWEVITSEQKQAEKQEEGKATKEGQPQLLQFKQVVRLRTLQTPSEEIFIGPKLIEFLQRNPEYQDQITQMKAGEVWQLKASPAKLGGTRVQWTQSTRNYMTDRWGYVWHAVRPGEYNGEDGEDKPNDKKQDKGNASVRSRDRSRSR